MWKLNKDGASVIRGDGAIVPFDRNNTDYIKYLEWCDKGNTALPEQTEQDLIDANNTKIKEELFKADISIIRALVENDQARINAFKQEQSDRRKKLVPPGE